MLTRIKFLIFWVVLGYYHTGYTQVLGLELLGDKNEVELEFEYDRNFILLKTRLSNLPFTFIFDTGAEHIILFKKEIADILGYPYDKTIEIFGADLQQNVVAHITRGVPIKLENTKKVNRDLIVLEDDFLHLEELTGKRIDGIIGGRFFRGLSVEIDYKRRKLRLMRKTPSDILKKGYHPLNMRIIKHKPYIECSIETTQGDSVDIIMLLDTGAAIPLLLFLNEYAEVNLPGKFLSGNLGKGLGGDIEGYIGKISSLNLSQEFTFNNIITSYQRYDLDSLDNEFIVRNGLLGNPLLERFKIVIDYVNNKLYFKPNKNFNKDFQYDVSGLIIYAFGPELRDFFVKEVMSGSPAEKAGIKSGDIIKRVGLLSTSFYNINGIYRKLIKRKNKHIKITVERNGQKLRKTLYLQDVLDNK